MIEDRVAILIVCQANICRSPIAEHLFRHAAGKRLGDATATVEVFSAGTDGWAEDRPMHPLASQVLSEYGIRGDGFRARPLSPALVGRADLVLTATRKQRSTVVSMEPSAVKRSYTLPQFARLATAVAATGRLDPGVPAARVRGLLEQIPRVRGQLAVPTSDEDDIADPARFPIEVFRRCAGEIDRIADIVTRLIVLSR